MTDEPLNRYMTGMAAGDPAFFFAFVEEFGPKVAWVVRDILREMGRHKELLEKGGIYSKLYEMQYKKR